MVMRDIGSFHCPEPRFISRGAAEGNKHGRRVMDAVCIPKKTYFSCFIVLIQYIYARLFTLEFFYHVNRRSDHTV